MDTFDGYQEEIPDSLVDKIIEKLLPKLTERIKKIRCGEPGEPGKTPKKGRDYKDGEDADTPVKGVDYFDGEDGIGKIPKHQWDGTKIRFQNSDENWSEWVDLKGKDGEDVEVPKKGVDYFDGEPGKTPIKGKDYFDGEDGSTPEKGVDYFDGEDGEIPKHQWSKTRIRFQNPDGKWGQWTELKGKDGKDADVPKKGEDYFDGNPGKDAIIPKSVTIGVLSDVVSVKGKLQKTYKHIKVYLDKE